MTPTEGRSSSEQLRGVALYVFILIMVGWAFSGWVAFGVAWLFSGFVLRPLQRSRPHWF